MRTRARNKGRKGGGEENGGRRRKGKKNSGGGKIWNKGRGAIEGIGGGGGGGEEIKGEWKMTKEGKGLRRR